MNIDKDIFGGSEISLPMKMRYLKDFYYNSSESGYNFINFKSGIMNCYPADSVDIMVNKQVESIMQRTQKVKAALHNPMYESLLDEYVSYGLNDKQMSYSLPEREATTLLKKITDKYKGKYVYLDFWSTFCGPCRANIESSKPWREELRNNPDFEFVYITGDKSSPKTTYEEYVAQNLNGAECYRIPEEDYKKLKVLFKFTGFPHHEALDPNGNVLKVNNTYYEGKDVFLRKIETMKRMQEK
jgi:thiol-disulfide isomerase/thioredoxin